MTHCRSVEVGRSRISWSFPRSLKFIARVLSPGACITRFEPVFCPRNRRDKPVEMIDLIEISRADIFRYWNYVRIILFLWIRYDSLFDWKLTSFHYSSFLLVWNVFGSLKIYFPNEYAHASRILIYFHSKWLRSIRVWASVHSFVHLSYSSRAMNNDGNGLFPLEALFLFFFRTD